MAGRPRGIDDAAILRAAIEVMGRVGPAGLTLAAVAGAVGLAPATLLQRFGSKRGLLAALSRQTAADAALAPDLVRARFALPLEALRALMAASMAPMATPESFANHLAFLCTDLVDEELCEHAREIHLAQRRAVETLLLEAVAAGELRAGTDTAALAETVQAITAGIGLTWALDRRGELAQRIGQQVDAVLSAHIPPRRRREPRGPEES